MFSQVKPIFGLFGFLRSTFENKRGLCNMLVLEQDVDVNVCVGGVHSVANQEGAVLAVQDLDPNPGHLLSGRHNLHLKRLLAR